MEVRDLGDRGEVVCMGLMHAVEDKGVKVAEETWDRMAEALAHENYACGVISLKINDP